MRELITANDIKKNINGIEIIRGISINIYEGDFIAVMGPSGAGKTTLMNIISGLEVFTSGSLTIMHKDIKNLVEPERTVFRRENIGYIFQDYNLIDFLNVKENIEIPLGVMNKKIDKSFYNEVLSECGLLELEKRMPTELSGGQKQRVAIARTIVSGTPIIFADEPTGALDLNTREQMMKLFKSIVKKFNRTVILVTHDPHVAEYADKTVFLFNGKIIKTMIGESSKEISIALNELEGYKNDDK